MAGYIRQDTTNNIADGNIINASDFDAEYDAIQAAFHATTGHTHDGTSAEGAPITKVGPAQDLIIGAASITPKTDNTLDLGASALEFKDLWIDGTANIDSLVADTADINAGTIDGTNIGASTPGTGAFTTLSANSTTTLSALTASTALALDASKNIVSVTNTGTGNNVLATSPVLTTPNLGTPSALTLTNATGLPTAGMLDNAVTDVKLRDSAALSVIGRATNTSGDPADIAAGTDHQVLRRSGTALGFGAVALDQAAAISGTLPVTNGGTGAASFTLNNVLLGNGSSAFQVVAPGTSGNVLTSNGTTWASSAIPATNLATGVTGTLGAANGGTGVANNAANTISFSGAFGLTLTLTNTTSVTFPTSGTLATRAGTETLTNKTIVDRVVVVSDGTSVTINADTTDIATQANTQAAGTLTINAPTGTPVDGQKLVFRLQSTNVQTFSWNGIFAGSSDQALPTASSGTSKYDYMGFVYNSTASKWQLLAKNFGF